MPAPVERRALRETVGQFATGVTVIAVQIDGTVHGMTANSFTSLSLDPPLVLFCVGKATRMGQRIQSSAAFTVNILRYDQQALSTYFAGAWKEREPPPFAFAEWDPAPRLEGCAAAVGCSVDSVQPGGDHWIVIGRVRALHRGERGCPPLVFFGGHYTTVGTEAGGEPPELTYLISGF